jgi:hypothetical protein
MLESSAMYLRGFNRKGLEDVHIFRQPENKIIGKLVAVFSE